MKEVTYEEMLEILACVEEAWMDYSGPEDRNQFYARVMTKMINNR